MLYTWYCLWHDFSSLSFYSICKRKEPIFTTLHFYLCILFQKSNGSIKGEDLHAILDEIDTNRNGQVELDEYLQVGTISCCFHDIFFNNLLCTFFSWCLQLNLGQFPIQDLPSLPKRLTNMAKKWNDLAVGFKVNLTKCLILWLCKFLDLLFLWCFDGTITSKYF